MQDSNSGDAGYIGSWAAGVYSNLNSPTNLSSGTISGWMVQQQTCGKINNVVGTSFSGISGWFIDPMAQGEELALFEQAFNIVWYTWEMQRLMGQGSATWVSAKEGDRGVTRANISTLTEIMQREKKTAIDEFNRLANQYIRVTLGATRPSDQKFYSFTPPRPDAPDFTRT